MANQYPVFIPIAPTLGNGVTVQQMEEYVNTVVSGYLPLSGGTISNNLTVTDVSRVNGPFEVYSGSTLLFNVNDAPGAGITKIDNALIQSAGDGDDILQVLNAGGTITPFAVNTGSTLATNSIDYAGVSMTLDNTTGTFTLDDLYMACTNASSGVTGSLTPNFIPVALSLTDLGSSIINAPSNSVSIEPTSDNSSVFSVLNASSVNQFNVNTTTGVTTAVELNASNLTASTALVSDASKNIVSSATTSTELGYVHNVTSAIQTQLNNITNSAGLTSGDYIKATGPSSMGNASYLSETGGNVQISSNLVPSANLTDNLGSTSDAFSNMYVGTINGSTSAGTLTLYGNPAYNAGSIVLSGGNTSTTPLTSNTTNVYGGWTNGGSLNLYGANNSTGANNAINITPASGYSSIGTTTINGATTTFNSTVNMANLTASTLVGTDGSKNLESITVGSGLNLTGTTLTATSTATIAGTVSGNFIPYASGSNTLSNSVWTGNGNDVIPTTDNTSSIGSASDSIKNEYIYQIYGGASGSSGSLNINASTGTNAGFVTITGGNSATTPVTSNTVNLVGGGSNGGSVSILGGTNATEANNQVLIVASNNNAGDVTIAGSTVSATGKVNIYGTESNGAGTVDIYGNVGSSTTGTINIYGNHSSSTGNVVISGSNSGSGTTDIVGSLISTGTVNIYGGGSATPGNNQIFIVADGAGGTGGTVYVSGGTSSTVSNNIVNIYGGNNSTGGNVNIGSGNSTTTGGGTITIGTGATSNPLVFNVASVTSGTACQFNLTASKTTTLSSTTGTWTFVSDERLKNNMNDLDEGLELINKIKPKSYIWNGDPKNEIYHGFSAQQLDSIGFKGAIKPETEDDFYHIDYNQLFAPMVKSIQELSQKVEDQQNQIDLLKNMIISVMNK